MVSCDAGMCAVPCRSCLASQVLQPPGWTAMSSAILLTRVRLDHLRLLGSFVFVRFVGSRAGHVHPSP